MSIRTDESGYAHQLSDLAIPPGEYLVEVLHDLNITQAMLARRMGRPPQAVNEIVKAEKAITPETAIQLERVLGVPALIWTRLEADYQLVRATQNERKSLEAETHVLQEVPYKLLQQRGHVEAANDPLERVVQLRKFFGVASLDAIKAYNPAFRKSPTKQASTYALAAWLRVAEKTAEKVRAPAFNRARLRATISDLANLTSRPIDRAVTDLETRLRACGVVLVVQEHFPKTFVNGATFWLRPDTVVVVVTIRWRWADVFWFSVFHELGHVALHEKGASFLEWTNHTAAQEREADRFAANVLIPPSAYAAFKETLDYTRSSILSLSSSLNIDPGIVVGRLQHEEMIGHHELNELRSRLEFAQ